MTRSAKTVHGGRRRIILVDDSASILSGLAYQARLRSDVELETFSEPASALSRIRQSPPDALVTDLRMPAMTGLELTIAARDIVPTLPVVVMTAYVTPHVRDELSGRESIEYLEKPFSLSALVAAVNRLTNSSTPGFTGSIYLPLLPDLIQLYALTQATGGLHISRESETGSIWFLNGEIVHASCEGTEGEEAVYRLLQWTGGSFALEAESRPPQRTIHHTWQALLLEGYRLMDELYGAEGGQSERAAMQS